MRKQAKFLAMFSIMVFGFTAIAEESNGNDDESIRLIINGEEEKYVRGHEWRTALASQYEHGAITSWGNGRTEEKRWDWNLLKFVPARFRHYHFTWEGRCNGKQFKHRNWHKFGQYKYR